MSCCDYRIFVYIYNNGCILRLNSGNIPGTFTETLKHNKKEGIKIAIAPLITDLPIIIVTYFIFSKLSQFNILLSLISFLGGIFFAYLGYETIKTKGLYYEAQQLKAESLKKGITANILNPHPYVFWLTVGIPTAFKAYEINLITVILYFFLFYVLLIGSKIGVALLVEKSKTFLTNKAYRLTMKILGTALFIFAALFIYDGINIITDLIK